MVWSCPLETTSRWAGVITDSRYKSFISYSHDDRHWAVWLQRRLESYRLPKAIAKARGLPRRALYPVFRDEDELAASSDLGDRINQALAGSDALIVICSPSAAASRWVNEEISRFKQVGNPDRVFCLIVGGDPQSSTDNCFPPELRSAVTEPLAADVRAGNRRSLAALKLIAALLDLGFDELRQRDRLQQRRRWTHGTAAMTAATAAVVGTTLFVSSTPPCQGAAERLAGIWDAESKQEVQAAFLASGVAFAPGSLSRTVEILDRYAGAWSSTHTEACEATQVRGEQSESLLDLRMECLDERRQAFAAVTGLLRSSDPELIERSIDLAAELPALERCSDRETLLAAYPLPEDEAVQSQIEALGTPLALARAQVSAGRAEKVLTEITAIVATADELNYPPLLANALMIQGEGFATTNQTEAAEEAFFQAAAAAARAGDDRTLILAWIAIISLQIDFRGDMTQAERLLDMADARLSRLSNAADLEAATWSVRGHMFLRAYKATEARDALATAVSIAEEAALPSYLLYAQNLVNALVDMRELDQAQRLMDEVYIGISEKFGEDHPRTADALWSMSRIAQRRGDYETSLSLAGRSISMIENAYGTDFPGLASLYQGQAWDQKSLGRFAEAHRSIDRSLEILEARPDDVAFFVRAAVYNTLGDLHVSEGHDQPARDAFREAVALWDREQPDMSGVAIPLSNLGALENRAGNHEAALAACTRSLELDEANLGPSHPDLAWGLICIADAQLGTGQWHRAIATTDRALNLLAGENGDRHLRAEAGFLRARGLWETGDEGAARALALTAQRALADSDPSFAPRQEEIRLWLSTH